MLNHNKHKEFMFKILIRIFQSPLKDVLAFKGGTLAFLCYGLPRFSTDIDLDLLDYSKESDLLEIMQDILEDIGEIKNMTLGKELHRWIFRYDPSAMNIKVEVNKRPLDGNTYERKTLENTQVYCMSQSSMVANKIVALYERAYPRDLFDVYYFLAHDFPCDNAVIELRSGKSLHELIWELQEIIPRYFLPNTVLTGLGELLTDTQKLRVKKHLVTETVALLDQYLQKNK